MTPPRILPPHYFVLSLVLMLALGLIESPGLLPGPWAYLGLIPIALGVWLAFQGSRLFARAGTNIVPFTESTALVTDGVFSLSRNPMYTGMVLALAGTAMLINSLAPWLVIPGFVAIIRTRFIRHEETLMEKTFGAAYLDYKARVRRWV